MFAVVQIPHFALQAVLRHEPELTARPVALIDGTSRELQIIHVTPAAQSSGVEPGLTPSQALARCPDVVIKSRSLPQEQTASDILLQTAFSFSPNVEETSPGVCTIDTKGLNHFDANEIVRALARLNLHGRVGVASTPALALLAAHAASPVLIVSHSSDFIAKLSIDDLDLPPPICEIVKRWGIRTAGTFLTLGKEALAERLGPPAIEVFERLSPETPRPLRVVSPPERFEEKMEFEHEIETAEPLMFALNRIVEQFSHRLAAFSLAVGELQLQLGLVSGSTYERTFSPPVPTRDVTVLMRMLQTHLESVRTDSCIISLTVAVKPCQPDQHQFGLFEATLRNPNQFTETLARLNGLLGADRGGQPILEQTHRPDAFHIQRPAFADGGSHIERLHHSQDADIAMKLDAIPPLPSGEGQGEGSVHGDGLSLRRYRPPLPVTVEFQNDQPIRFHGPHCRAAIGNVRGPFVLSGDWWDNDAWDREEWDVQAAEGSIYRLCRSTKGCFVEGVYD